MYALCHEGIESAALVDFVKVWVSFALKDDFTLGIFDRRPVGAVEHTFDEVGSRAKILEALLVLDADCVAAVGVTNAASGYIHFTLFDHLCLCEAIHTITSEVKIEAFFHDELIDFVGFSFSHGLHLSIECALAELLLIDASLEE